MVTPSANTQFPFEKLPVELGLAIFRHLPDSDRKTTVVVDKWFKAMTIQAARSVEWHRVDSFCKALAKKLGISLTSTVAPAENLNLLRDSLKKEKEKALESLATLSDQHLAALGLDSLLPLGDPQSPHYIPSCPFSKDFFKIAEFCRKADGYAKTNPNLQDDQNDLILQGAKELVSLGEEDIAIKLCHTYYPDDANIQSSKLYGLTRMLLGPLVHQRNFNAAHLQAGMKIIDACDKIVASIKDPEWKCLAMQMHLLFAYLSRVRLYLENGALPLAAAEVVRMETVFQTFFPAVSDEMSDKIHYALMPFLLLGYIRTGQVERAIAYVEQIPAEKTDLKILMVHLITLEFCRLDRTDEIIRVVSNYASGLKDDKDLLLADLVRSMCCWLKIPSSDKAIEAVAFAIGLIEDPNRILSLKFYPFARMIIANANHYTKQNEKERAIALLDKWFDELKNKAYARSIAIDAITIYTQVAQSYAEAGDIDKAFSLFTHLHPFNNNQFVDLYRCGQKIVRTLLMKQGADALLNALNRYKEALKNMDSTCKGVAVLLSVMKDEYLQSIHKNTEYTGEIENISPRIEPSDSIYDRRFKILAQTSNLIHWDKTDQIPQLLAKHLEGLPVGISESIKILVIMQLLHESRCLTLSTPSLEHTLAFTRQHLFATITDPGLKVTAHLLVITNAVQELVRRRIRAADGPGAVALLDEFFQNMPAHKGLKSIFIHTNFALHYAEAGRLERALELHRDLRPITYPEEEALDDQTEMLAFYTYSLYEQPALLRAVEILRVSLVPDSDNGRYSLSTLQKWSTYLLYFYGYR